MAAVPIVCRASTRSRKPGAKPFDLAFDRFGHVDVRAVGHVAVRPGGVLAFGRARRVEEALLRQEHEGAIGVVAALHGALARGDLGRGPAYVHGRGAQHVGVGPRDRNRRGAQSTLNTPAP